MNNSIFKILICLQVLCFCIQVKAQRPVFVVNSSNNYASITTYNGVTSSNAYELKIVYSGTNLNVPNWKMSARLKRAILSEDGTKQIPADKISFIPTHTSGQATPNPYPTLAQIGVPPQVTLNGFNEVFFVPQSNAPLYNISQYTTYYYLQLHYNLQVAGGAYLQALQGGDRQIRYNMLIEFKAYGHNNEVLGTVDQNYIIDIFRLSGNPPVEKQYTIKVSGLAKDALIELRELSNYTQGTSVTYNDGLSVSTNTDYELKARSLNTQFQSTSTSQTLPLDIIKVELIPVNQNNTSVYPILLSNQYQTIGRGVNTQSINKTFNIRYSTQAGDNRLIQTPPGKYTTTLEFQILPR